MSYYTYEHRAGYGSADHMADEIIARAARRLGIEGAQGYIAASAGFVSHAVPMGAAEVRVESAPGVRRRMIAAIRAAEAEVPYRCRDVRIDVVLRRVVTVQTGTELATVACAGYQDGAGRWRRERYESVPTYGRQVQERRGREWVEIGCVS